MANKEKEINYNEQVSIWNAEKNVTTAHKFLYRNSHQHSKNDAATIIAVVVGFARFVNVCIKCSIIIALSSGTCYSNMRLDRENLLSLIIQHNIRIYF